MSQLLLAAMLAVAVGMWFVLPLFWLAAGSAVKEISGSTGLTLLVMFSGAMASIAATIRLLSLLESRYMEARDESAGSPRARSPLEPVLVVSAGLAFAFWWVFLATSKVCFAAPQACTL